MTPPPNDFLCGVMVGVACFAAVNVVAGSLFLWLLRKWGIR